LEAVACSFLKIGEEKMWLKRSNFLFCSTFVFENFGGFTEKIDMVRECEEGKKK